LAKTWVEAQGNPADDARVSTSIESRTLGRAAELLGGRAALARRLQVPLDTLDRWLKGEERPPNLYFLSAVDVVLYNDVIEPSCPGDVRPWKPDGPPEELDRS
jgi:hypothetical protein